MNQHAAIPTHSRSYERGEIQDTFAGLYKLALPTHLDLDYERIGRGEYVFFATQDNAEGEPHAVHAERDLETFEHWVMGLEALSVEEFAEEIQTRRDRYSEAEQIGWGNWSKGDITLRHIEEEVRRKVANDPAPIPDPAPSINPLPDSGPAYRFSQLADLCAAYPGIFGDEKAVGIHADRDAFSIFLTGESTAQPIRIALREFGVKGWEAAVYLGGNSYVQRCDEPAMGFSEFRIFANSEEALA